jgi:hypothetical protein
MDGDAQTRARIMEHWRASEQGDSAAEHAIYSGNGDLWVSECVISYDGVPSDSVSIMEFSGGFVAHETQYFADPFDPAPWRAALAERMPDRSG